MGRFVDRGQMFLGERRLLVRNGIPRWWFQVFGGNFGEIFASLAELEEAFHALQLLASGTLATFPGAVKIVEVVWRQLVEVEVASGFGEGVELICKGAVFGERGAGPPAALIVEIHTADGAPDQDAGRFRLGRRLHFWLAVLPNV